MGIRTRARARRVCARNGLPIAELRYTLVPKDDHALKQSISDFLNMSVPCIPLNYVEIKKVLFGIPRQLNPYMGVFRGLGEYSNEGGGVTH